MTPLVLALVVLAGVLGFVRLWSLRHSRRALLTLAIPAALLPLAAATVAGAWDFRADWTRIGETGNRRTRDRDRLLTRLDRGADRRLRHRRRDPGRRARSSVTPPSSGGSRTTQRGAPTPRLPSRAIAIAAIAALPIILARSERAAVGPLVQLVRIANLEPNGSRLPGDRVHADSRHARAIGARPLRRDDWRRGAVCCAGRLSPHRRSRALTDQPLDADASHGHRRDRSDRRRRLVRTCTRSP